MHRFLILALVLISCSSAENESTGRKTTAPDTSAKPEPVICEKLFVPGRTISKHDILKLMTAPEEPEISPELEIKTFTTDADGPACEVNKFYLNNELVKFTYTCGDCSLFLTEEIFYVQHDTLVGTISKETWYNYQPCLSEEEMIQQGITPKDREKEIKTRYFFYYVLDSLEYRFSRKINFSEKDYP